MSVFLGLVMLTDRTSHTPQSPPILGVYHFGWSPLSQWEGHRDIAKPNLKTNHSLIWKLVWKQIPRMVLHLFGNKSLILITTSLQFSYEQNFWTLVAHPLASTNPSSTLPWTTNRAPRCYASRLLPPQMSRRKAWVSAVCWEPLEARLWKYMKTTWWITTVCNVHGIS